MSKLMKATAIFIGAIIAIIAVWDIYVLVAEGTEASISHQIIVWSYKYPIATFMAGLVCGHLFWRMRSTKYTDKVIDKD